MKKNATKQNLNIEIFNIVNEIIFSSVSMPDVYKKIENITIRLDKWFELNETSQSIIKQIVLSCVTSRDSDDT